MVANRRKCSREVLLIRSSDRILTDNVFEFDTNAIVLMFSFGMVHLAVWLIEEKVFFRRTF